MLFLYKICLVQVIRRADISAPSESLATTRGVPPRVINACFKAGNTTSGVLDFNKRTEQNLENMSITIIPSLYSKFSGFVMKNKST